MIQINEDFVNKLAKIKQEEYYDAKNNSLEFERKKQLDSKEIMRKKRVKKPQKTNF